MSYILKIILFVVSARTALCSIAGISYMDPLNYRSYNMLRGEDRCHPLYWYPRNIPEYCYHNTSPKPSSNGPGKPVPVPVLPPAPMPFNPPVPYGPRLPYPPQIPVPPMPYPMPMFSSAPLPFGVPLAPTNPMIPIAGEPYLNNFQEFKPMAGMVPGLSGLVSPDGGINILPFSDAYSDLLEKHKQKMMRKKLKHMLDDYDRRLY